MRKKKRHTHRRRIWIVGFLAVAIVVGVGAYLGLSIYDTHMNTRSQIDGLVNRLSKVDETLVEVDRMMKHPLNREEALEKDDLTSSFSEDTIELNRVSVDANTLKDAVSDQRYERVAAKIDEAAIARKAMIAAASDAMLTVESATEQESRANNVWNTVLNADYMARESIAMSNKATTKEETEKALAAIRKARESFSIALGELNGMHDEFAIDFTQQIEYLEKKLESLDYAAETSDHLLKGDRQAAQQANELYNKADEEAAYLASKLPPTCGDAAIDGFTREMETCKHRYGEARMQAVEADTIIREYLAEFHR